MASAALTTFRMLVIPLLPFFGPAQAQTNITPGSFLIAGKQNSSWKSPSGDFAFGFQSVGNGSFLLAIWFDKIPDKTVIWSVNGDKLAPEGSKVELTRDGNLVLSDPEKINIWAKASTGVSHASLLDSGNFVLRDNSDSTIWESFSEPSDTLMPQQVLNQGAKLVSRYSDKNYSTGRFELSLNSDGFLGSYTPPYYDRSSYYWSIVTNGSGNQVVFNQMGQIYVGAKNGSVIETIMNETVLSEHYYQRAILEYDGVFRQYVNLRNGSLGLGRVMNWSIISSPVPPNICTSMWQFIGLGACGVNSYCTLEDNNNRRPKCRCPTGYSYINPSYEMDGCKPDFLAQSCEEGLPDKDSFIMQDLLNANWPNSDYGFYPNQDEETCRQTCLNDCFCSVAIIDHNTCWKKRIPLSNGMVDTSITRKAFIKMRINNTTLDNQFDCPKDKGKSARFGSVFLCSSVSLNLILLSLTFFIWFRYLLWKNHKARQAHRESQFSRIRCFTYTELRDATGGFKELLGQGAYGSVYKGILASDKRSPIAVKVLEKITSDGDREFKTEVDTIGQTNHRNLAKLIGFCNEAHNRILVYEFMPNGSLSNFLFTSPRQSWLKRAEIACGVARGLLYLHEECTKHIIHCDIKPHNVLLDESLMAKISDFGLAKLLKIDQTRTMTAVRGTKGYLAPEWYRNMRISVKVDVYSFGIVLLELICCRKNSEFEMSGDSRMVLSDWVYHCYHKDSLEQIVKDDKEMLGDMNRVRRFVMIAIWCIQEEPSLRPSMKKIAQMLEGAVEVSTPPAPFSFISSIQ